MGGFNSQAGTRAKEIIRRGAQFLPLPERKVMEAFFRMERICFFQRPA
jgi:hypothetical protein